MSRPAGEREPPPAPDSLPAAPRRIFDRVSPLPYPPNSAPRRGFHLAAVHLAVLLFGAAGLFAEWLDLAPTTIVLGRVVFASIVLGAVLAVRRSEEPRGDEPPRIHHPADRILLPALGLLLAVHWVTFFHAIQVSSVAVGLLTFASFPVFAALLEPLLPGERFDPRALIAGLVTAIGVALVVPAPDPTDPVARGAFWGVISGATFAALSLANRGLVRRLGPIRLAFHQDLWAAVFLLPVVLLAAPDIPDPAQLGLLVLLGVVFTAGAHALFIHGLETVTAGRAAVIATLEPVYGVALAALLLGDRPGARVLLGGTVILLAALLVGRRRPVPPVTLG